MALDPRLECLPEHEGPAFRTWQLIMQTTMGKVMKPNGFQFCSDDNNSIKNKSTILDQKSNDSKKPPLKPAEEFISLNSSELVDNQSDIADENSLKRKKSQSSSDDSSSSSGDDEDNQTKNFAPWKARDEPYPENAYGLHLEIIDFYNYISPLPEEESMRNDVVKRMSDLIRSIWPAAKVEVFGSFRTNLYLPTSDIDLAVFGKWENLPLFTIEKALISNDIAEPSSIKVLDKATVPIIKLTDKISKIRVDISFNTETSVKSAEMVKSYMKEFDMLPYIFLVLKQFLVQRDLNEVFTGGISSYCLMLLAVSFLQRHPRVDVTKGKDKVNLGVLLMEFFELYGRNFNYQKIGVKIRDGGRYISKEEIIKDLGHGEYPALLCIEDPVTLACDIGRSSYGILRVKESFEYAFNVVDSALRNKSYFKVNPNSTYLSRIISLSKDLTEYRKWVKKTFDLTKTTVPTLSSIPPPIYHVALPQYRGNTRPALLPTPPSPYSPHLPVVTLPFMPSPNSNIVPYNHVFFDNNNMPSQQVVLHPVTTENGKLMSTSEIKNLHPVRNESPGMKLQQVGYVVTSVFNPPQIEQVNQPPTTPVFSPVKGNSHSTDNQFFQQGNYQTTRSTSNNYQKRNNNSPGLQRNSNFDRSTYNKSRNSNSRANSPRKGSPRTNPKFSDTFYTNNSNRSTPSWMRDNQNYSRNHSSSPTNNYNTSSCYVRSENDFPPVESSLAKQPTTNHKPKSLPINPATTVTNVDSSSEDNLGSSSINDAPKEDVVVIDSDSVLEQSVEVLDSIVDSAQDSDTVKIVEHHQEVVNLISSDESDLE